MREVEEQLFVELFGEQEGAFLRAGRAEIESFARHSGLVHWI